MYCGHGYQLSHTLSKTFATYSVVLSLISEISNHPVAGSIIVSALSTNMCMLFVFSLNEPIELMLTRFHGTLAFMSFGGKCPFFLRNFLHSWQLQHVFTQR
jgi:hypothetical protein